MHVVAQEHESAEPGHRARAAIEELFMAFLLQERKSSSDLIIKHYMKLRVCNEDNSSASVKVKVR